MKTSLLYLGLLIVSFWSCKESKKTMDVAQYQCVPCDLSCDKKVFDHEGKCPHCNMALVPIADEDFSIDKLTLHQGSGSFPMQVKTESGPKDIYVFYHMPKNFDPESKVLIVIPGSGRNGDDYRDAWIRASEKHNVLVLAPIYPEPTFGFDQYHLGGVLTDLNIMEIATPVKGTNQVRLDESLLQYKTVPNSEFWIFDDMDHIFNAAVKATGSHAKTYDVFGHSAGGQILHRFAIFHPESKANRILAGNSGFYTLPDLEHPLFFGLGESPVNTKSLIKSFKNKLVVFLGEKDNASETGGTLLLSPTANLQGHHRLERGHYFYNFSKKLADSLQTDFQWKLHVVPGVGHEYKKMSAAAAEYLYSLDN